MARFFSQGVYRVGDGVSIPRLISSQPPEYTAEAHSVGIEGSIELLVSIGQDGFSHDMRVQRGLGYGLDETAIECVGAWRFSPGKYEGKPVPVAATVKVHFRLEHVNPPERWRAISTVFAEGLGDR